MGESADGGRREKRRRAAGRNRPRAVVPVWVAVALVLVASLGGPRGSARAQGDADTATVRVVHGAADAGAVDLYVDGGLAVAGIAFPSVSDPIALPVGEHELRIVASGAAPESALVAADVVLESGRLYEVAALGTLADLQVNLYEVDLAPPATGRARLRLIHGAPDAGPLALAVGEAEEDALPAVDFPNESEAVELEAGSYDLELRTDDGAAALSLNGTRLEGGVVYDLFAVGQAADDSLRVLAVVSRPEQAPSPGARPAALYAGACAGGGSALDEVVSPLNAPALPVGEPLGQEGAALAANSVTGVEVPFDDIVAADHAIAVLASDEADAPVVACGEVGGAPTENGALVVGLRQANGSGVAGVAILAPSALDPATTDVSVFVSDGLVGVGAAAAGEGDATPPATAADRTTPARATPEGATERENAPTPTPTGAEEGIDSEATPEPTAAS